MNNETKTPEVGMGATYRVWSDRHACTIVEIRKNGSLLVLQRDKAKRTDSNGMSESQSYEYSRDPDGELFRVSLRKNGAWKCVGQSMNEPGGIAHIGNRCEYYDYSF